MVVSFLLDDFQQQPDSHLLGMLLYSCIEQGMSQYLNYPFLFYYLCLYLFKIYIVQKEIVVMVDNLCMFWNPENALGVLVHH